MVLEFFRQIPNCSGVHRRSSPGYRGSFSPPVSNDTDSRSSLSERTVKRVASRYLERARKAAISLSAVFFCIFVPRRRENRNLTFFAMGMKLTILGSGTLREAGGSAAGVPSAPRKILKITVCGLLAMLEWDDTAGDRRWARFPLPDAPTGVRHIDAILLTHEHKDHIGGLDDVGLQFRRLSHDPSDRRIRKHGRRSNASARTSTQCGPTESARNRAVREIDPAVPLCVKDKEVIPVSGHHSP